MDNDATKAIRIFIMVPPLEKRGIRLFEHCIKIGAHPKTRILGKWLIVKNATVAY
jgi:hypothetical protein